MHPISHRQMMAQVPFRRYVGSVFMAMMGNGLTYVIMVWVLMSHQPDVASTAILMTCFWLPSVLLGPVAGVFVDHYERKKLMIGCNVSRILCLIFYIIGYTNAPHVLFIYLLCLLSGIVFSLYMPASISFIREMIKPEELTHGNALVDIASEFGAVIGMGMAGLVLAHLTETGGFVVNIVCYLIATWLLVRVYYTPIVSKEESPKMQFFSDLSQGFYYLMSRPSLLLIYTIQALLFIVYMTTPVLLGPYAKNILLASAREYGYIEALLSLGIVSGGLACPMLATRYGMKLIIIIFGMTGLISFAFLVKSTSLWQAYLIHIGIGLSFSIWPLVMAQAQDMTDIHMQGRVQSLMNSFSGMIIILFYYLLAKAKHLPVGDLYQFEVVIMLVILLFSSLMRFQPITNEQ